MSPPDPSNMFDALTSPAQPGSDALTLQILAQIRDSMSAILREQRETRSEVGDLKLRMVRIEERDRRLEDAEKALEKLDGKVDALLRDKDQREGAAKVFIGVKGWTPVILAIIAAASSIGTAVYMAGRATGFVGAPPVHVERKL